MCHLARPFGATRREPLTCASHEPNRMPATGVCVCICRDVSGQPGCGGIPMHTAQQTFAHCQPLTSTHLRTPANSQPITCVYWRWCHASPCGPPSRIVAGRDFHRNRCVVLRISSSQICRPREPRVPKHTHTRPHPKRMSCFDSEPSMSLLDQSVCSFSNC